MAAPTTAAELIVWLREAEDDALVQAIVEGAALEHPNISMPDRMTVAARTVLEIRSVSRQAKAAETQARTAQRQAEAATAQAMAADQLATLTRRLVRATWGLAIATLLAAIIVAWVTARVASAPARLGLIATVGTAR